MNIFEVKKISCLESYLQTSTRDLTLYLRCYPQQSQRVVLAYGLYGLICLTVFIMSIATPILMPILALFLIMGILYRQQLKTAKTSYEVWKFEQHQLMIFKFKAPRKALTSPQLDDYLNQDSLAHQVNVSDVENVKVEEYCNEDGYQYICRLNVAQSIFQICLSYRDAYLLESQINHWLTAKA